MTDSLRLRSLGALQVPEQGLGCMGMSDFYGTPDDDESVRTIHRALELGVRMLDTSDMYGQGANEELVGKALSDRRDRAIVATKFGVLRDATHAMTGVRGDKAFVRQSCEASLRRLGTDHIDLYYLHRVDPRVEVEETFSAMAELVKAGKVGHLGLSEAPPDIIRRAHSVHPVSAVQTEWSLWSRDIEVEVVPTCRELGIGIVGYAPLGRGMLGGTISSIDSLPDQDLRRHFERFAPGNFEENAALVTALEGIAKRRGATTAQLALAWLAHQGDDVVAIPGTKRQRYLEQNVAAVELRLSDGEIVEMNRLSARVTGRR